MREPATFLELVVSSSSPVWIIQFIIYNFNTNNIASPVSVYRGITNSSIKEQQCFTVPIIPLYSLDYKPSNFWSITIKRSGTIVLYYIK